LDKGLQRGRSKCEDNDKDDDNTSHDTYTSDELIHPHQPTIHHTKYEIYTLLNPDKNVSKQK